MKFRTELHIPFLGDLVNYRSKILTMGSCFADEIGRKLHALDFDVVSNPFGVLFNPVSILRSLQNSLENKINQSAFLQRGNSFFHYDFHSSVSAQNPEALTADIIKRQQHTAERLHTGNSVIITFGTAWAYRHLKSGEIVANCHKIPHAEFQKELLDLEVLKTDWTNFLQALLNQNKDLKIILTVSPVRHIKDGLHENNLSKSILLLLAHHLKQTFASVHYFPAYELVVDDLRDYRFFKEDLIHPNGQAVQYVFEKFAGSYFSAQTIQAVNLRSEILKLENHRPIIDNPEMARVNLEKINALRSQFTKLRHT
jgi:hypothetical protein